VKQLIAAITARGDGGDDRARHGHPLDMAERITVLHYGRVIVEGTRAEVWPTRRRERSIFGH